MIGQPPVIVVDIMQQVCNKIPVNFMHDSPEAIESELIEMTKAQAYDSTIKKYPVIILFHDFPEDYGGDYGSVIIPKMIIATITDNKFKAEKRYNETFRTILYPLYQSFLFNMAKHPNVVLNDPDNLTHRKWDRLYWGTKPAGTGLNDYVDAIEIQNLKLTTQQLC